MQEMANVRLLARTCCRGAASLLQRKNAAFGYKEIKTALDRSGCVRSRDVYHQQPRSPHAQELRASCTRALLRRRLGGARRPAAAAGPLQPPRPACPASRRPRGPGPGGLHGPLLAARGARPCRPDPRGAARPCQGLPERRAARCRPAALAAPAVLGPGRGAGPGRAAPRPPARGTPRLPAQLGEPRAVCAPREGRSGSETRGGRR